MEYTFKTAEEARKLVDDLLIRVGRLPYNHDLHRFGHNISALVRDLSQLEVYARRTHPRSRYHTEYKKLRETIMNSIKHLDQLILIAQLMA